MEIWKDIEGYEGKYQVSNLGRVKSLNYNHTGKERVLKPSDNGGGYLQVDLCKDSKRKSYSIHRLVLTAFKPVDNMEKLDVNHKDEVKTNNALDNLEWCDRTYNMNYGTRNKRAAESLTGVYNTKCSIPIVQLTLEGTLVNVWRSSMDAQRENGYNHGAIIQCCKNKFNRPGNNIYKNYKWMYLHEYLHKKHTNISTLILNNKVYDFNS